MLFNEVPKVLTPVAPGPMLLNIVASCSCDGRYQSPRIGFVVIKLAARFAAMGNSLQPATISVVFCAPSL